jgi:hypothetical protein
MCPLSSNDTSAVGGSVERTRQTILLPVVSLISSPSMNALPLSPALSIAIHGRPNIPSAKWHAQCSSVTCLRQVSSGMNNVCAVVVTTIPPNGSVTLPFVIPQPRDLQFREPFLGNVFDLAQRSGALTVKA